MFARWNQVSTQEASATVIPTLDEIEARIRQLGIGMNTRMESIENIMKSIAKSENRDVELEEQKAKLRTTINLRNCLQSAASVVSSASTFIHDRNGIAASNFHGSDFGDVFQPVSTDSTRTWIETNVIGEVAESDDLGDRPDVGGSGSAVILADPAIDWDSDEEHELELATALLNLGTSQLKDKDFTTAESRLKSCIGIITEKELTSSVSNDLSMVKLNAISELITALREQSKWEEVYKMLREKIAILSRSGSASSLDILFDTLSLAEMLHEKGESTEACLYARTSYRRFKRMGASRRSECIRSLTVLVEACSASGKQNESDAYSAILHSLNTEEIVGAFAPSERSVCIASRSAEVKRLSTQKLGPPMNRHLDLEDRVISRTLESHSNHVTAIAFSPDGNLASASFDRTVKLWSTSGALIKTLEGHEDWVMAVSFSPDGRLASASFDKTVKLWSTSGALLRTLKSHSKCVNAVAFSPDGRLASASNDQTVKLWSTSGTLIKTLESHKSYVNAIAFSPNGRLASASFDKTVKLWSTSGALIRTLESHSKCVNAIAFSPDGRLASASNDQTIKLWESDSGALLQTLEGHTNTVKAVAFSPDGKQLASASMDRTVKLWDLVAGAVLQTLEGHRDHVTALRFSPNGKQLASASADSTIKLWSAPSVAA
jgi:WD40 repeat protein